MIFNEAGPHEFRPLRWWDALRRSGRCSRCRAAQHLHPTKGWESARALGDKSRAYDQRIKLPF